MAYKSILMDQIEKIRDLLIKGHGNKSIARLTGMSKNTIKKYREKIENIETNDKSCPLNPTDVYTRHLINTSQKKEELLHLLPEYLKQLRKTGMTREFIYAEYIEKFPAGYSYGEFCRQIKNFKMLGNATLNFTHKAGEVIQVDFAGKGLEYMDEVTGQLHKAEVLVCILPFSKLIYVIALESQKIEDFIYGITCAFNYFGGTPKVLLSDNLKSYVTKSDRYCPTFTQLATQLSSHYEIELDSTRVGKPKDKASVERSVSLTYQNIHVHINQLPIGSLSSLNNTIKSYLDTFNNKICRELEMSRFDYFIANEKDNLKVLPCKAFDLSKSIQAKVQNNYHFLLGEDRRLYSVPYVHIGKYINVVYNTTTVEVFCGVNRIAIHNRTHNPGMTTDEKHRPEKHNHYLQNLLLTPQDYIDKAAEIGPNMQWAMTCIVTQNKVKVKLDKLAQGLISLYKHYPKDRLEQVCTYIKPCGVFTLDMIKNILASNIDLTLFDSSPFTIPPHENTRGANNYN